MTGKVKKFPISEALTLLDEGIIDNFSWSFSDIKEAETHRNSITSTQSRRKDSDLKLSTMIVQGIKANEIITFVTIDAIRENQPE